LDSQVELCNYNTGFFSSIFSATGRQQAETMDIFVKLDARGIQRLYFQRLIRKTSQFIFFSMHIELLLLGKSRQTLGHKAQTQQIKNNSKVPDLDINHTLFLRRAICKEEHVIP